MTRGIIARCGNQGKLRPIGHRRFTAQPAGHGLFARRECRKGKPGSSCGKDRGTSLTDRAGVDSQSNPLDCAIASQLQAYCNLAAAGGRTRLTLQGQGGIPRPLRQAGCEVKNLRSVKRRR